MFEPTKNGLEAVFNAEHVGIATFCAKHKVRLDLRFTDILTCKKDEMVSKACLFFVRQLSTFPVRESPCESRRSR
jgi:hypothetical protein